MVVRPVIIAISASADAIPRPTSTALPSPFPRHCSDCSRYVGIHPHSLEFKVIALSQWRVAQPGSLTESIAAELDKAAEVAQREGMRLVIENEETCNAATGSELARVLAKAPAANLGANWDVGNGYMQGEKSFPDGYDALDKSRIWHVHLKGMRCQSDFKNCAEAIAGQGGNDLTGQLRQFLRDGYQGTMSLECEFEAPGMTHTETTRRSMQGLLRAAAQAAATA